jgi:Mrp family chromosome partitioning ATPase
LKRCTVPASTSFKLTCRPQYARTANSFVTSRHFSSPPHDFVLSHPSSVEGSNPTRGRIVVITSGKGGVGKTTSAASFAHGLASRGQRTCVVVSLKYMIYFLHWVCTCRL